MLILLLFSSGSFGMRFYVFFFLSNLGQVSFYLSFRHLHFKLVLVFSEKIARGLFGKGFRHVGPHGCASVDDWVYGIGPMGAEGSCWLKYK